MHSHPTNECLYAHNPTIQIRKCKIVSGTFEKYMMQRGWKGATTEITCFEVMSTCHHTHTVLLLHGFSFAMPLRNNLIFPTVVGLWSGLVLLADNRFYALHIWTLKINCLEDVEMRFRILCNYRLQINKHTQTQMYA